MGLSYLQLFLELKKRSSFSSASGGPYQLLISSHHQSKSLQDDAHASWREVEHLPSLHKNLDSTPITAHARTHACASS